MNIQLSRLLQQLSEPYGVEGKVEFVVIQGFSFDSRVIQSGELFGVFEPDLELALRYVEIAYGKGVRAFVVSQKFLENIKGGAEYNECVWIVHPFPRRFFAKLAGVHYAQQPQHCVAVTGTSGKTSVADLVRQLWVGCGVDAASIGTLGVVSNRELPKVLPEELTSPDPVSMLKLLSVMKQEGIEHVILEASSHGIDQGRSEGVSFSGAAFTNLSQDHLDDFHTMENYFSAKHRLFSEVIPTGSWAVLNADIPEYHALLSTCESRGIYVMSYGCKGGDVRLISAEISAGKQLLTLEIQAQTHQVYFALVGMSQVYNLMCALAIVMNSGVPVLDALSVVPELTSIAGRLEKIATYNGANIYVDYAHKPGALDAILKDLRSCTDGKLHVVFGCGGDRDTEKRPLMGEVASNLADVVVITDDNPRTEDPAWIRKQVLAKCSKGVEVPDRKAAIRYAMSQLEPGDTLVVAGKGHESYQIIGTEKLPFNDADVIKSVLKEQVGKE